jgi:hypothetical protein
MSNRIDFFQPVETRLALPGTTVSILLDGTLCTDLEVMEIVRSGWPEFSWAKLAYNPAAAEGAELVPVEQIETLLPMGKSIRIRQVYNGLPPGAAGFALPLFDGQVESIDTTLGPDGEMVQIIARDLSAALRRTSVYGQRLIDGAGCSTFLGGLETVFNPDGRPNANANPTTINGKNYTVFCPRPSESKLWTYAEAIDYLLCEYLVCNQLHTPSIEQLTALSENQIARDLDVTGSDLIEALHRCCNRIGLKFKFVPRLVSTGPRQAIVFYKQSTGRIIELNCQPGGEQLSITKTNVARLSSRKSLWPVTHRYIGQGDFKVHEATFELVKAWDPADQDTDYDKFSPSSNAEFYKVKDVYRKWCLNEAGDYSGEPYNQGDAFDFSKIFQGGNFVRRRRRFWPTLTTDKQRKTMGYFLEVSFDGGSHWWQYLYAFNNLLDECGVWLSSDRLDANTWVASLKGVLRFRITASVISDERLTCVIADGPVNSTAPEFVHLVTLPRQFKYRKVSDQSIFAQASDDSLGVPDEADDSTALYEFVRQKATLSAEVIETVEIHTPILEFDYTVGDQVTTSPQSRDLLSCRTDNRSVSWIERVSMDFQKQCTNLKIVRKRGLEL